MKGGYPCALLLRRLSGISTMTRLNHCVLLGIRTQHSMQRLVRADLHVYFYVYFLRIRARILSVLRPTPTQCRPNTWTQTEYSENIVSEMTSIKSMYIHVRGTGCGTVSTCRNYVDFHIVAANQSASRSAAITFELLGSQRSLP